MGIFDFFKGGSNDNQDNIIKTYHENGQLESEINYKDGKSNGLWKSYDENGKLEREGYFKDGELDDGLGKTYHENGKLESLMQFIKDDKSKKIQEKEKVTKSKEPLISDDNIWVEVVNTRIRAMPMFIIKMAGGTINSYGHAHYEEYKANEHRIPKEEREEVAENRLKGFKSIRNHIQKHGTEEQKFHLDASIKGAALYASYFKKKYKNKKGDDSSVLRVNDDELEDVGIITHYNGKPFDGIGLAYEKGNLIIETPYYKGLKEGVEKRYFENGKLKLEDEYINDKLERRINEYLDDGTSYDIIDKFIIIHIMEAMEMPKLQKFKKNHLKFINITKKEFNLDTASKIKKIESKILKQTGFVSIADFIESRLPAFHISEISHFTDLKTPSFSVLFFKLVSLMCTDKLNNEKDKKQKMKIFYYTGSFLKISESKIEELIELTKKNLLENLPSDAFNND